MAISIYLKCLKDLKYTCKYTLLILLSQLYVNGIFFLLIDTFQGKAIEGDFGKALPLIIFGGLSVAAGVASLILPETKGKILPETIHDAEHFGRYGNFVSESTCKCI